MAQSNLMGDEGKHSGLIVTEAWITKGTMTSGSTNKGAPKPRPERVRRPDYVDVHQFDDPNEVIMPDGTIRRTDDKLGAIESEPIPQRRFPIISRAMDSEIAAEQVKQTVPSVNAHHSSTDDDIMDEQDLDNLTRESVTIETEKQDLFAVANPDLKKKATTTAMQRSNSPTSNRAGESTRDCSKEDPRSSPKATYADKARTGRTYNGITGRTTTFQPQATEKAPNPYDDDTCNPSNGAHITHGELRSALDHLPAPPEKPSDGMRAVRFVGNTIAVKGRMFNLQQRGNILYTVDFNP
ncbi:unnamed protein product [Calypogeia fissa]